MAALKRNNKLVDVVCDGVGASFVEIYIYRSKMWSMLDPLLVDDAILLSES